jgi:hypothetical protein
MTGAQLDAKSVELGVTSFARPEDGSWSRKDARSFYFNTTGSFTGVTRNWHLSFDNPLNVTDGGVIDIVVAGAENPSGAADAAGPRMLDNLTTTGRGQLILQEDPGNQAYIAGVYRAKPSASGPVAPVKVLSFDPALFTPGVDGFITKDEESSGVIPAPFLGADMYLLDVQVHASSGDPETVEPGQLLVAYIPAN